MVERNRKSAGRESTREAWIKQHEDIAKRAERKEEKGLDRKKEQKITEIMGMGYKKVGQEKEQTVRMPSTSRQVSTPNSNKRISRTVKMSGIVWDQSDSKMDQTRKPSKETSESFVDDHVLPVSTDTVYIAATSDKRNELGTEQVLDKKQQTQKGATQNLRSTTKQDWASAKARILQEASYTQVKIKKELIDEAVSQTSLHEESSNDDDEMSTDDMLDNYSLSDDEDDNFDDAVMEVTPANDSSMEKTIFELSKAADSPNDKLSDVHGIDEEDNSLQSGSMDDTSIEDVMEDDPQLDHTEIKVIDQQEDRNGQKANEKHLRKTETSLKAVTDTNVSKRKSDQAQILQQTKRLQVENMKNMELESIERKGSGLTNTAKVAIPTTQVPKDDTLRVRTSTEKDFSATRPMVDTKSIAYETDQVVPILKSTLKRTNGAIKVLQTPGKTIRKVDFTSTVQVVTTAELDRESLIKSRGLRMIDTAEKVITPIRVEYNLPNTITQFNVREALQTLLTKMSASDQTIKILNMEQNTILWDRFSELSENADFSVQFKMKEQTYRKGNKKVSLYCIVESQFTINRIKYANEVKEHIFENNIWIKPEFYSTQVVSCPGFFTLVHPRITHKTDFTDQLKERMQKMEISSTEKIVTEWYATKGIPILAEKTVIPRFHLETSTRKWGGISTEVLSVHCPSEDAQYLKYLLVEACSDQTLHTQIFVPTGIHLLEGKEVMTELLREHQNFISTTTSCQIGGFSVEDMNTISPQQHTVKNTLQNIAGVHAVERMYHTERSGQWTLVIDSDRLPSFVEYVKQNLSTLYRMKTNKVPKLISYKIENGTTGYRLLMTEGTIGKVGTYAEALKRRFATSNPPHTGINGSNHQPHKGSKLQHSGQMANTYSKGTPVSTSTEMQDVDQPGDDTQKGALYESHDETSDSTISTRSVRQERINKRSVTDKHTTVTTAVDWYGEHQPVIEKKIESFEQRFQQKINEMEQKNTKFMAQVEKSLEERMEAVLEEKLSGISNFVALKVTEKLAKQINKMLHRKIEPSMTDSLPTEQIITQESPTKTDVGISTAESLAEKKQLHQNKPATSNTTQKMLAELTKLEKNTTSTDSTHDNKLMESSNKVT